MHCRLFAAILAALVVVSAWDTPAWAKAGKVDCNDLDFSFAPAAGADWAECYRYRQSEPTGDDNAYGISAVFEYMLVDLGDHVVSINTGKAGPYTYFTKNPVRSAMGGFDELTDIRDWNEESDYKRYELARFRSTLFKFPVDCVGFVKYAAGTISGRGSSVGASGYTIGYDCWRSGAPDRAKIEATLGAIK